MTINLPTHKRTIRIGQQLYFVEFQNIQFNFHQLDHIRMFADQIKAKIIKPKSFKWIIFNQHHPICLGKEYKMPISKKKINQMIDRFFNSKFKECQVTFE